MPVTRKRKIEVARLAGFGLVLAGLFALFLAVVSSQDAGAEKSSAPVNGLRCASTSDSSADWIGAAVQYGACQTTTSTDTAASTTYVTTTTKKKCGCSHPTTTYVTTTIKHQCGCSTTSTAPTTTTPTTEETLPTSSTGPEDTTPPTEDTLPTSSTGPEETTPNNFGPQGSTTIVSGGIPVSSAPVSEAEAVSGQLPFTGSSGLPLAGFGLLMVATGLALALRRHRFAR